MDTVYRSPTLDTDDVTPVGAPLMATATAPVNPARVSSTSTLPLAPTAIVSGPPTVTVIDGGGATVTVIDAVLLTPPDVAEICALPAATAVTVAVVPAPLTEATVGADELHDTEGDAIGPLAPLTAAVSVAVCPTAVRATEPGVTETPRTTVGGGGVEVGSPPPPPHAAISAPRGTQSRRGSNRMVR